MIGKIISMARRKYFPTELEKNIKLWYTDNGEVTFRLNYPELNDQSVVFDLGGYKGQFASDIYSKYLCNIYVIEPVKKFFQLITQRFERNKKIHFFQMALGNENKEETIFVSADATSTHRETGTAEKILFKRFDEFLQEQNITHIDLLKINIEGGEYDLLEFLIEKKMIPNISNIQVQFHDFIPDAIKRMEKIQEQLKQTHTLTYQYRFIWENWKLKQ